MVHMTYGNTHSISLVEFVKSAAGFDWAAAR